jgi:hypothetical protein
MLSNLLDKLGALLSKYFVIGSFIPVLIFAFLNGALLYWNASWFRGWAESQLFDAKVGFVMGVMLIGLAVTAYVFSSVSVFLREVLEGKHFRPLLPKALFENPQRKKRDGLLTERERAREEAATISDSRPKWRQTLSNASREGADTHTGTMTYDGKTGPAVEALNKVRNMYKQSKAIPHVDLEETVELLADALKTNDKRVKYGRGQSAKLTLDEDQLELLILIDNAEDTWAAREVQAFNEKEFQFGMGEIAPTAMGNIAQSMQSYTYSRYHLNLETFWSRLQLVLQSNKDFYANLLDTKTQLDFLVACYWLSGLTTVLWIALLLWGGHSIWPFLVVSVVGPLLSMSFYRLAVKNYLVFADIVRTGVDLYRFGLLQSLHVVLPHSIRDERATWQALERLSSYGQEEYELSYQHSDKPQPR